MTSSPRTYQLDLEAHRAVGRLRLVAACAVIACAAWLATEGAGAVGVLFIVVGALVGLGWLASWYRGRSFDASAHWLRLGDEALEMRRGDRTDRVVWREVEEVVADEDRVSVRVVMRDGEALHIPLVWRGAGLHDLRDHIDRVRRGASGGDLESDLGVRDPETDGNPEDR